MPGKHWLVETEDGGEDSEGVTEKIKSKILLGRLQVTLYYLFSADLMENKRLDQGGSGCKEACIAAWCCSGLGNLNQNQNRPTNIIPSIPSCMYEACAAAHCGCNNNYGK